MNRVTKIGLGLGLGVILLLLTAGGWHYYKSTFAPRRFVSGFLQQLEYEGAKQVDSEFFISRYPIKPILAWEDFLAQNTDTTSQISKENLFQIWKEAYLSELTGYVDVSISYPALNVMTGEQFSDAYGNIDFSAIKLKHIKIKDNRVDAAGYATLKCVGNESLQMRIGGEQKWELLAARGHKGWRIIAFAVKL
jgi:hypothetical protein